MHQVFDLLERFARTDVSIVLQGETGVGKEWLAHAIHESSARAGGPLAVFDCGSVAPNLAESELLGHERGSFTGAIAAHPGAFERAEGGTLFLDEVGELPLELQSRLLRALESKSVRRVGGRVERPLDARVVGATNRDLKVEVGAGRLREDLYFRLAVAVVHVPPLRERLEDLPSLVPALLAMLGRPDLQVSDEVYASMRRFYWPGNIRELRNILACGVALLPRNVTLLERNHLRPLTPKVPDEYLESLPLAGKSLEQLERVAIEQTLHRVLGDRVEAARSLGIALSTLYEKIRTYEL